MEQGPAADDRLWRRARQRSPSALVWRIGHTTCGAPAAVLQRRPRPACPPDPGIALNIDIYSDRAKSALQAAQGAALAAGHQQFAPEHLLKALLDERDGLARDLLRSAGGDPDAAVRAVDVALAKLPKVEGGSGGLHMTPALARVSAAAEADAKAASDAFVTTERLLVALAGKDGAERPPPRLRRQASPPPSSPPPSPRCARAAPPTAPPPRTASTP